MILFIVLLVITVLSLICLGIGIGLWISAIRELADEQERQTNVQS